MQTRSTRRAEVGTVLLALWALMPACGGTTSEDDGASGGMNSGGSGGSSGGASGGGGSGGSGGSSSCNPVCGEGRDCCGGACVNLSNDPHNCGACDTICTDDTYCTGSQCVPRPCTTTCAGSETCCAGACCGTGELCCDPQGPLDQGPVCTPPTDQGTCPQGCAPLCICASPDTPIATPTGERPISSLRVGDLVYSVDGAGIKAVPLTFIHRTAVSQHHVMRVKLSNGATLEISAGHPTADGRTFADLRPGQELDQARIVSLDTIPYEHAHTYDILPASDSGTYFAGGALIGSTLRGVAPGEVNARCTGAPESAARTPVNLPAARSTSR